jgi:hypothetical protein
MERNGAEIVTTEMVVFEGLETAEHPRLRDMIALINPSLAPFLQDTVTNTEKP